MGVPRVMIPALLLARSLSQQCKWYQAVEDELFPFLLKMFRRVTLLLHYEFH